MITRRRIFALPFLALLAPLVKLLPPRIGRSFTMRIHDDPFVHYPTTDPGLIKMWSRIMDKHFLKQITEGDGGMMEFIEPYQRERNREITEAMDATWDAMRDDEL